MRTETCSSVCCDINVLCWTAHYRLLITQENTTGFIRINEAVIQISNQVSEHQLLNRHSVPQNSYLLKSVRSRDQYFIFN